MDPIRTILIVGGGSSGWMTATLLRERLKGAHIQLIEASDIPIIGVGESTNPVTKYFHQMAKVNEREFLQASNGAYKIAIRFENFNAGGGVFFHPFGQPKSVTATLFKPRAETQHAEFHLASGGNLFSRDCAYAYQIDAGLYGQYLKGVCKRTDVEHIVDHVTAVEVSERGEISCIRTESGKALTADLYIDCSGFRSLLLGEALQEPFRPVGGFLLNDRAIAARVPYSDRDVQLKCYTNCTGLSAGWVWEIPLWSRLGTGYVYSSSFASQTDAEAEFRSYIGEQRVRDLQFNHIKIRAGRHERAWVKNCVAIGVSYGFLEPLESTGLSLTQVAIIDLAKALSSGASSVTRQRFNRRHAEMFDNTRDFILAHYVLTRREDTPYWRHIRYSNEIPDSLGNVLEEVENKRSYLSVESVRHAFYDKLNWNIILSGMGLFDRESPLTTRLTPPQSDVHANVLRETVYNGEYADQVKPSSVEPIGAHPMWAPTW